MPRRIETLLRRARRAANQQRAITATLVFLNTGRAEYEGFVFDSTLPEHAKVHAIWGRIIEELHHAAASGTDQPMIAWRRLLQEDDDVGPLTADIEKQKCDEAFLATEAELADVAEYLRTAESTLLPGTPGFAERIETLRHRWLAKDAVIAAQDAQHQRWLKAADRMLVARQLRTVCELVIERYLLHPRVQGYRLLSRCAFRECEHWFIDEHRTMYCSDVCRGAARKKRS